MPNLRVALTLFLCGVALSALPARALPVFAHRFGFSCQQCHSTVPQLNEFGERFRANGFQLPVAHGAFPVAVKVNVQYSSDKDPGGLPKAIVDEVELLSGGTIGPRINYFLEQYALDGGVPGRTRDAWMQFNAQNLHLRVGQQTLTLPVDVESERPTIAHYALFEPLFDARLGADVSYTDDERGWDVHAMMLRDGGAATHLYAAKSFAGGTTLYAYAYNANITQAHGAAVSRQFGKMNVLALGQNGGAFVQGQYAFSDAISFTARAEQTQRVLSLALRPRRNMRLTIEDDISDHHALGLAWLFAY